MGIGDQGLGAGDQGLGVGDQGSGLREGTRAAGTTPSPIWGGTGWGSLHFNEAIMVYRVTYGVLTPGVLLPSLLRPGLLRPRVLKPLGIAA